ncbi:MAG: hypothetical protein IJ679_00085 [Lachnospiraceae bacterium]|nr:hypothetical protein [Lachnospiraceae bacterium]
MKRNKQMRFEYAVLIFGLLVALGLGLILAHTVYIRKGQEQVMGDAKPVGDEESDSYDWKGDYMDTMYLETSLSIEGGVGGVYQITLTWGGADSDELSIWKATGSYDKSHRALVYKDMVRTNMTIPTGEGETIENDMYSGGSGFFFLRGGKLYWEDKNEDFGDGLQFEKVS